MYFVSSNPHSMVNLLSGTARRREDDVTDWVEADGPDDLREELAAFREGRTDGSWENFLYFSARDYFEAQPAALKEARSEEERAVGISHISSRTALRVSAQVIALDSLDPRWLDPRLGDVDPEKLVSVLVEVFTDVTVTSGGSREVVDVASELMSRALDPQQVRDVEEGIRAKEERRDAAFDRFSGSVEWWRHDL